MNREEAKRILTYLKVNFPNYYKQLDHDESEILINSWQHAFKDTQFSLVSECVMNVVENENREYPPNIAFIKNKLSKLADTSTNEDDAWQLVKKSLQTWSYVDSYNALPADIKKCVTVSDLQDWGEMQHDEIERIVYPHFRDRYRRQLEQEREYSTLSNGLKQIADNSSKKESFVKISVPEYMTEVKKIPATKESNEKLIEEIRKQQEEMKHV